MTKPIESDNFADFAPAPVSPRHDGWTAERQRAFISALADTGCVSDACKAVRINPRSAYRLRRRPGAEAFDAAWKQAQLFGIHRLTTLAFERAVYGSTRQIWKNGELVAEERTVSDRLLMFLLTHFDSLRYGELARINDAIVRDPRDMAREELPAMLDQLRDIDEPADPFGTRDFTADEHDFDDR